MTAAQMAKLIGAEAILRAGQQPDWLFVSVRIVDLRTRFGGIDAQIEPVAGRGRRWVQLDSLLEVNA